MSGIDTEALLAFLERLQDARTEYREEVDEIRYELKELRRIHGPGPHMVSPGLAITISRTGKPKQV